MSARWHTQLLFFSITTSPLQIFSFVLLLWPIFSLVVIFQRRMNMLHFLETTLTALQTLRMGINISVLTVRTGEKHSSHSFCHRKAVRESREELLDSLTWAAADCQRNHFRELGDVVGLTWAETPGAESQKHQANQLDVQSCHHLSAFWQAGPDRETLKERSLRVFSCLQLALRVSELWKMLWPFPVYIPEQENDVIAVQDVPCLHLHPPPVLSPLPPPFPLSLISSPTQKPWLKVTIFSNCSCCSGFLTHGKSCSKALPYTAEKAPLVAFFSRFLSCPRSRNLSFCYLERWGFF